MVLKDKIKKVRKQRKWSQDELAKKIGITASHLSRLERGQFQPSADVLKKLGEELQVSVDYLLSDKDENVKNISIQDASLAERIRLLNSLEGKDKDAIIHIIDSILTKKKILNLLVEHETTAQQTS